LLEGSLFPCKWLEDVLWGVENEYVREDKDVPV